MALFLIVVCLCSILTGYLVAAASWTGKLWQLVRDGATPESLRPCLNLPWQRSVVCVSYCISALAAWYGCARFGFPTGAEIASSFVMATLISRIFLQPRIHGIFHLRIVLRALEHRQMRSEASGDLLHAKHLETLTEKVTKQLYAMKALRSAGLVPNYDGSTLYLSISGAKADNYHTPKKNSKET